MLLGEVVVLKIQARGQPGLRVSLQRSHERRSEHGFSLDLRVALRQEEDGSVGAYADSMPDAVDFGGDEAAALVEMAHALNAQCAGASISAWTWWPPR